MPSWFPSPRISVSIRAPARGATSGHLVSRRPNPLRFNPRPRTGSDGLPRPETRFWECFNPRPRTGSDRWCSSASCGCPCFNPRPRTGSDLAATGFLVEDYVSIRAPARGATVAPRRRSQPRKVSIRAPARGATVFGFLVGACVVVSIRAPARGATWKQTTHDHCFRCFNPRPRTGSDLQNATLNVDGSSRRFNPRPRTGSDTQSLYPSAARAGAVSIRAPARGATVGSLNALKSHV